MTARARIRVDDVKDALRVEDIIAAYNLRAQKQGAKYRLAECPRCGAKSSSWAISINTRKGTWGHFGHGRAEGGGCYGDLIDLVGALEGFGRRSDFGRVLARCAEIAGVQGMSVEEMLDRTAERAERARQQHADEVREADERRRRASAEWRRLRRQQPDGQRYLHGRRLDAARLVEHGYVLFDSRGNVGVPLHDLVDGELVTVTYRLIAPLPHDPTRKIHTPSGGTTRGTLCGRVQEIGRGDTIVTEGIADTLTAIQLWPDATVLGASGAGQLRNVVEAAAPRVRTAGGRMVIVPDADDVGQRCAIRAGEAALDVGLVIDRTLVVLELPEHDLNDSYQKGWRP